MTSDSTVPDTALRADARRNRIQLIEAAGRMFAEHGPDVAMEEIARAAGVGIGTLYRRFPDREALIRGVCQDNYRQALDEARLAQQDEPTAWQALVRIVRHVRALQLSVHLALVSPKVHRIITSDELSARSRAELLRLLDEVVRDAQREGTLRRDVGTGDVAMLCSLLLRENLNHEFGGDGRERRARLLLDALRTGPPEGLAGDPVGLADLDF